MRRSTRYNGTEVTTIGVLAQRVSDLESPTLEALDITARRNAFGRQVDSFQADVSISALTEASRPFHAVFIRAPVVDDTGAGVEVLASLPAEAGPAAGGPIPGDPGARGGPRRPPPPRGGPRSRQVPPPPHRKPPRGRRRRPHPPRPRPRPP